jgi:cullin 2
LTLLVSLFKEHIKQEGLQTVTNLSGDRMFVQFVEGMVSFHSKCKEIINTVFSNDQLFSSALDRACAEVVNHPLNTGQHSKSHPEQLARYSDSLLKKSTKGFSDTEVDDKLTQCITVFKYIDDQDVFRNFYSLLLANRLIQQRSRSMDAEEAMINRLKLACGFEFTNKLQQMLTDMSVSSDLNNKFNLLNKDRIELGLDFSINVLKTGAWPRQVCPTDFAVPQELEKSIQEFEDFYRLQFNGRKLTWLHNLSCGELKLNYLKQRYFITVGTFQMAMLLVFQKTDSLTCGELMEATKLNPDQFQKTVKSLVNAKLLAVTDDTVEVFQPSTVISLNMDYSNKRTKFRINNSVKKEQTVQETEITHSSVNVDRKHYLQVRNFFEYVSVMH